MDWRYIPKDYCSIDDKCRIYFNKTFAKAIQDSPFAQFLFEQTNRSLLGITFFTERPDTGYTFIVSKTKSSTRLQIPNGAFLWLSVNRDQVIKRQYELSKDDDDTIVYLDLSNPI